MAIILYGPQHRKDIKLWIIETILHVIKEEEQEDLSKFQYNKEENTRKRPSIAKIQQSI